MEGMKRANMVSFLGWTNKLDDYSGMREKNGEADGVLERTGSGMSALSAYGRESDSSCDDLKRKRIKEDDDPGNLHLSQHNRDVISHPNGRLGAPIYQKHQRRTSDEQEYADIAALRFRGVHHAVNNFKPVAEAGYTQKRFLCGGEMGDALQDHSNITAEEKSSSPEKEKSGLGRQHMFDKAVTPSDVGKLNRLVIPKQHAEKYFPLDTNANDKGLLLNFEDNAGKTWRFRYSYWNSSQSYVLTKGWSRFVKEKKLDAGDIVSFERGTDAQNAERLFISWRRRPCALQPSKAALLHGLSLPSSTFPYAAPFQSHALNIRPAMTKLGQAQQFKAFPEWMSVVWSANNGGASSRLPPMWAEQPPPQPQPATLGFHAAEAQNCSREPLDFMQLKTPSWPVENPSVKTSKKGVRLFGVNL